MNGRFEWGRMLADFGRRAVQRSRVSTWTYCEGGETSTSLD